MIAAVSYKHNNVADAATESKTMKQTPKKQIYIVCAVLAVACIAIIGILGTRKPKEQETTKPLSSSQGGDSTPPPQAPDIKAENKPEPDSPLGKVVAENPDAVAWIRIPNTAIDNAVMQSNDNSYYLTRNEKGEKDVWGSYFADYYANLLSPETLMQNTVIYGHTENKDDPNGKRFSQLYHYLDMDFMRKNPNIFLTIGNEEMTFEVFAVFFTHKDFYYIDPNPSEQGFDTFMSEVNARNEYIFEGNPVTEQDKIITLSGCAHQYDTNKTGDHRFVVMGRLVDENNAGGVTVSINPSPIRPK